MSAWHCKLCGCRVSLSYDHAGSCHEAATEDACQGSFWHPQRSACSKRGDLLKHGEVLTRQREALLQEPHQRVPKIKTKRGSMLVEQEHADSGTTIISFVHSPRQRLRVVPGDVRDLITALETYVDEVNKNPDLAYDAHKMRRGT